MSKNYKYAACFAVVFSAFSISHAQVGPAGVSPFCLSVDCGEDLVSHEMLESAIDFWQLDYHADMHNPSERYEGHHIPEKDILVCTSVCYKHYKQSIKACEKSMLEDRGFAGLTYSDSEALEVCKKSVRDKLYACLPKCNPDPSVGF